MATQTRPPGSPFGILDRADMRSVGRVTVFETADAIIFEIPPRRAYFSAILSMISVLVFLPFLVLVPIGFIYLQPPGILWMFALGGIAGAAVGIWYPVTFALWQLFGCEWVRVTRDKIEIVRQMVTRHARWDFEAENVSDLKTCLPATFFQRRAAARFALRHDCPAGNKTVQFRYGNILKGFGQDLQDAEAWELYDTIVQRFPRYRGAKVNT